MIEMSVESATQWVVFEPNTAQTWIRIKVSVENFLDQQWRAGALAGTKPDQAYRVRVGLGETMTETDIDLGLIITEVAIAPPSPPSSSSSGSATSGCPSSRTPIDRDDRAIRSLTCTP